MSKNKRIKKTWSQYTKKKVRQIMPPRQTYQKWKDHFASTWKCVKSMIALIFPHEGPQQRISPLYSYVTNCICAAVESTICNTIVIGYNNLVSNQMGISTPG